MSLELQKQAEYEMQQRLDSIPLAKSFPMPRHDILDREIELLEKGIKRLKAFVSFLSLLSPTKYIEWMKAAYKLYVPGNVSKAHNLSDEIDTTDYSAEVLVKSQTIKPGKSAKKTNTKRYALAR